MSFPELEATIKDLVKKNNIQKAIACLFTGFQDEENLENIILLSARYHSIENDYANGVIDYDAFQKTMNQLRINILSFIKKAVKPTPLVTHSIENQYRLSLARICVLWILKQEQNDPPALNMSKIHALSQLKNRKYIAESIREMEQSNLINKCKVEKIICWKLTEKGVTLAQELEYSLLFDRSGK